MTSPTPEPMRGWIVALESDREDLEQIGVKVGPWNAAAQCFDDCEADEEVDHAVRMSRRGYVSGLRRVYRPVEW